MFNLNQTDHHSLGTDVYVIDLVRTTTSGSHSPSLLAAISTDQYLSVLDPSTLSRGPVARMRTDHGVVSTLSVFGGHLVCTAGENGSVGVWDVRAGKRVVQFDATDAPIISMACNPQTHSIAIGTELHNHQASILIWDVRSSPSPKSSYHDLHSDDITTLTYHPSPSHSSILLSGSTDGLVSLHDTSIADEDEVTLRTLNLGASLHRAGFLADDVVCALSHDEKFAVYGMVPGEEEVDRVRDFGDLRTGIGCRYVADVVPKSDGSGAIVGAGCQDRQMFELVFLSSNNGQWEMDKNNSVGLPGAHGSEVVRAFCFFDEEQAVFTAGEDGVVKAWRA